MNHSLTLRTLAAIIFHRQMRRTIFVVGETACDAHKHTDASRLFDIDMAAVKDNFFFLVFVVFVCVARATHRPCNAMPEMHAAMHFSFDRSISAPELSLIEMNLVCVGVDLAIVCVVG